MIFTIIDNNIVLARDLSRSDIGHHPGTVCANQNNGSAMATFTLIVEEAMSEVPTGATPIAVHLSGDTVVLTTTAKANDVVLKIVGIAMSDGSEFTGQLEVIGPA